MSKIINKKINTNLKSALKHSFTPPSPQRRDAFVNSISYPKATLKEVFISQIGFIRKRVWLVFALTFCFAFYYVSVANITSNIVATMSALLPACVICVTSELYKSCSYNMEEMELACKYNLQKVTLMRLALLGTVSFLMLVLFIALANRSDIGLIRTTIYLTVPYLFSNYISLCLILKFRGKETLYMVAGVCGFVSLCMLLANTSYAFIYHATYTYLWVLALMVLSILLISTLIGFTKSQEELQWNLN